MLAVRVRCCCVPDALLDNGSREPVTATVIAEVFPRTGHPRPMGSLLVQGAA